MKKVGGWVFDGLTNGAKDVLGGILCLQRNPELRQVAPRDTVGFALTDLNPSSGTIEIRRVRISLYEQGPGTLLSGVEFGMLNEPSTYALTKMLRLHKKRF